MLIYHTMKEPLLVIIHDYKDNWKKMHKKYTDPHFQRKLFQKCNIN